MKIAVFPGTFDPVTVGHIDLVQRALPMFDKVIVAAGVNSQKKTLYSLDQRLEWLRRVFDGMIGVEIDYFEGLTVKYCIDRGAKYLLRGLRNGSDFDYEKTISQLNYIIGQEIDTVFLISQPQYSFISSTVVRDIIRGKGDVSNFVPSIILDELLDF
jgi:pantetheine-phosphate adenylyltransferase